MQKFRVIVKERKKRSIRAITPLYDNYMTAKAALDASKSGYGSRFIKKHFTFIKIEGVKSD